MKRVAFLTSGGDCQGLNAAMRGVALALYRRFPDLEIYGILKGYQGLIHGNYRKMKKADFETILDEGGTILGTSRTPFKLIQVPEADGTDKVKAMKENYAKWKLDCLVVLGGNGTHKTANLLSQEGLNVVTLPKTIDNDIWGTDISFGFQSAIEIATRSLDELTTTAASHDRIFLVELMGHKTGWLTLYSGIAGGADVILIPEIPYDVSVVAKALKQKREQGKNYFILAVAEGAMSKTEAAMTKRERKQWMRENGALAPVYRIEPELKEELGAEVRVTVPGHVQRGGSPCPYDRMLASRLGAAAAELIANKKYGYMVSVKGEEIVPVPLTEVAGKLKKVDPSASVVEEARGLGICFGDE